MLRRVNLSI